MPAKGRTAFDTPLPHDPYRFLSRSERDRGKLGGDMTVEEYNTFCASLPHTSHVVQWGGAHVWKVAGKVFAIAGWNEADEDLFVTFKCSAMSFDLLKDMSGLRPAPYLASRGLTWVQRTGTASMDDAALRDYLAESHRLIALGLPKRRQKELGLNEALPPPHQKSKRTSDRRGANR